MIPGHYPMSKPKSKQKPPRLIPHTEGRWQVIDPDGYVVFCGSENHAHEYFHSRMRRVEGPTGSVAQAIRRLG